MPPTTITTSTQAGSRLGIRSPQRAGVPRRSRLRRWALLVVVVAAMAACGTEIHRAFQRQGERLVTLSQALAAGSQAHFASLYGWCRDETDDPANARSIAAQAMGVARSAGLDPGNVDALVNTLDRPVDLPTTTKVVVHRTALLAPAFIAEVEVLSADGGFVSGLTRADFELATQTLRLPRVWVQEVLEPVGERSIALSIDCSASMKGDSLRHAQQTADAFIRTMSKSARLQLWKFSDDAVSLTPWTTDHVVVLQALTELSVGGRTELYAAIDRIGQDLGKRRGPKVIVLLSDGQDSGHRVPPAALLQTLLHHEVMLHAVGFGQSPDSHQALRQLAEGTHGSFQHAANVTELNEAFRALAGQASRKLYRIVLPASACAAAPIRLTVGRLPAVTLPAQTPVDPLATAAADQAARSSD